MYGCHHDYRPVGMELTAYSTVILYIYKAARLCGQPVTIATSDTLMCSYLAGKGFLCVGCVSSAADSPRAEYLRGSWWSTSDRARRSLEAAIRGWLPGLRREGCSGGQARHASHQGRGKGFYGGATACTRRPAQSPLPPPPPPSPPNVVAYT